MSLSVRVSIFSFYPFKSRILARESYKSLKATFSSQFDLSEADNARNTVRGESKEEISRTVNQGYLSFNSAESSAPRRICPRMLAQCSDSFLPFIHPFLTQLEGQKGELISISLRGKRVYSQTSLLAAAGDGGPPQPPALVLLFPFDFLSFSHFLSSPLASPQQPF